LKKFNFSEDEKKVKVSLLSPWQKNRLLLALFSLIKYNTIILDEPTNHLDLEAIDELEKTLQSFNWNIILVRHDKWFMDEINFDKKYETKNGKLTECL
jgi:ATPase subunit of ABC transporter with duplicated ATPase domains